MSKFLSVASIVVMTTSTVSLAEVVSSTPASAATTAGDPFTSGCDLSAITGKSVGLYQIGSSIDTTGAGEFLGNLDLRYSTSCETEWVTFYPASGYAATNFYLEPSVWLQNQTGTNLYTAPSSGYMGEVYTNMLPSMKYRTACGGMQVYQGIEASGAEQEGYVGWAYIGCW